MQDKNKPLRSIFLPGLAQLRITMEEVGMRKGGAGDRERRRRADPLGANKP